MNASFRRAVRRAAAAAAAVLAAIACASTGGKRTASEEMDSGEPDVIRVFASGDTRGHLEPCGCDADQFGGLPRRGAYLRAARRPQDLLVDLGNLTSGEGALRDLRRSSSLDALVTLGYDALVPGPAETFDGDKFRQAARTRAGIRVVCANWSDAQGQLLFEPWIVKTDAAGRRVALVGLTEALPDIAPEYRVRAPEDALRDAVRDLAGKADAIVVGAAMSPPAAARVARAADGCAVVLVGATPEDAPAAIPGGVPVEYAGELGSYMARADLVAASGGGLAARDVWRAWLDESTGEDERMTALVDAYREKVVALDAGYVDGLIEGHRKKGFAGSESCRSCHQADWTTWRESLHGHAMDILVEKKSDRDPDCVPCHLVDVPPPAAYTELGVGCEACHGPSAQHVESARGGAAQPARTPQRDAKASCASQCHRAPFVKTFALETHWPRIAHGMKK